MILVKIFDFFNKKKINIFFKKNNREIFKITFLKSVFPGESIARHIVMLPFVFFFLNSLLVRNSLQTK